MASYNNNTCTLLSLAKAKDSLLIHKNVLSLIAFLDCLSISFMTSVFYEIVHIENYSKITNVFEKFQISNNNKKLFKVVSIDKIVLHDLSCISSECCLKYQKM